MTVMLHICGKQSYPDQDTDTIEMMTEGELTPCGEDRWELRYEESELTGMEGVTTAFLIAPGCITLTRTGKLNSEMVFQQGVPHDSLYETEFGTLMITVCAERVAYRIGRQHGRVDLDYRIDIEQSVAGKISYHLDIQKKP